MSTSALALDHSGRRSGSLSWFRSLTATAQDWSATVLRLTLALVIFPHGAQKLLGWFGGYGFGGTMGFFTGAMGLPWILGFAVIVIEFFGPLALAIGVATRAAALGIAAVMIGAVATTHAQFGFFMNWGGTAAGEGFEFHLLALGIAVAVMIKGGGAISLDREIVRR
jgi:putative oxidoreductase